MCSRSQSPLTGGLHRARAPERVGGETTGVSWGTLLTKAGSESLEMILKMRLRPKRVGEFPLGDLKGGHRKGGDRRH